MDLSREYDVLVIGGGNAALCAAITARRAGASVLVLESSQKDVRAGNSKHTRNFRCMHTKPMGVMTDAYLEDEYFPDLMKVTGGQTNEKLARMVIQQSEECYHWMTEQGIRFQPSLGGTLHLSRTNAFFLGGGKALINALYRTAESLGIDIEYNSEVYDLNIEDGKFKSAVFRRRGFTHEVRAKALVAASGGFQANTDWLKKAWGDIADNFLIRGTPSNKGVVLKLLLDNGIKSIGDPTQCHAVAIDARAPKFDGGIITRVDAVSLGIVVNRDCNRFYDEGEDFWPKRYAIWGRIVANQPGQIAYSIIDAKSMGRFMPPVFPPIEAGSIKELAVKLKLDPDKLETTVNEFNQAVQPGKFDHTVLDKCVTQGLTPEKTNWARKIDKAPFYAYPLRPGITFTFLGVTVNDKAQVIMNDNTLTKNIFAAGEIMAGNVLPKGYLAGFGMTIGTVFGRIAGREAASYVKG